MKNKKNGPQQRGKSYSTPPKKYGNRPNNQRTVAMGFAGGNGSKPTSFSTQITCYKCGRTKYWVCSLLDKDPYLYIILITPLR